MESLDAESDPGMRNRRLRLLEEAIARQEVLDRRMDFTMRFNNDEGGVDELVFGEF
jgi:hypothetical protein